MYETLDNLLGPLERRWGRLVTLADWDLVRRKAAATPGALSDDECLVVRAFGGEQAYTLALSRRSLALLPPEPEPPPPAAPTTTADPMRRVVTLATLKKIFTDYNAQVAEAIVQVTTQARAPLLERLAALDTAAGAREAKIAALEHRLLELEADRAAKQELLP